MSAQEYFDDVAGLKTPPYSLEAEQAVLGGLLIDPGAWDRLDGIVAAEDFYRPEHRRIFEIMAQLGHDGSPIDPITVADALSHAGQLEAVGGFGYIAELAAKTPGAANVRAYAQAVRERAQLRSLILVGAEIADSGYNAEGRPAAELVDEAQRRMMEISEQGGVEPDLHVSSALPEYIEELRRRSECDGLVGLATGFTDLDRRTKGFTGGELIIIAGRPGSGKTTLAMNIAEHVALRGEGVLVFSMEMSRLQLVDRMVASVGDIPYSQLRTGEALGNDQYVKVTPAFNRIKNAPLFIDERGALTVQQMRSTARRQHKRSSLSLIVVDYLQLARAKGESRVMEITLISQGLKALAKELKVPIIALSQLSRKCEEQKREPISSDLRDSGSIEQDADSIFLIYRDEVYNENTKHRGMAKIICTKLRNGEPGSDWLQSNLAMCKFQNLATAYQPQDAEPPRPRGGFEY